MFGKKKDKKQDQSILESKEEPKLTDDNKSGWEALAVAVKKKSNKKVIWVTRKKKALKVKKGEKKDAEMVNVTQDSEIKGTIKFGQAMRIDGKFDGELITDNGELVVGKTGTVKANVKVRSAVIEGRVYGNIRASDKIELKQSAHFIGDLQAKTLVLKKGVVFVGKCNVNPGGTETKSQSYKKGIKELTKEERVEQITFNRFIDV